MPTFKLFPGLPSAFFSAMGGFFGGMYPIDEVRKCLVNFRAQSEELLEKIAAQR